LDKPLLAVDTLFALALASRELTDNLESVIIDSGAKLQSSGSSIFAAMLDARRQEIWLALYDADMREIAAAQPLILENNSFENFVFAHTTGIEINRIVLSGNGVEKVRSGGNSERVVFSGLQKCSARYLATLGEQLLQKIDFQDIAYFEPFYMKPPNITTSSKLVF
jgi:tRNA threonylcarbamoyladenosine biosynthesis protein TsaB